MERITAELVKNIAMQIAAFPVEYISLEDIPAEVVESERKIERGREDLAQKPESIRETIIEGRIWSRLKDVTLLEQSYIRDSTLTVKELIERNMAALGERIQIRRFARFVLGENLGSSPPTD
ncbi:MAG: hypothetical protein RID09_26005 [Coleofasciculus sp. G1-WW12-02]